MNLKQRIGEAMLLQALARPDLEKISRLERVLGALSAENRMRIAEQYAHFDNIRALAEILEDPSNRTTAGILMKEVLAEDLIPSLPDCIPKLTTDQIDAVLFCSLHEHCQNPVMAEFNLATHASPRIKSFIAQSLIQGSMYSECSFQGLPLVLGRALAPHEIDQMAFAENGFRHEALSPSMIKYAAEGASDAVINMMAARIWEIDDDEFETILYLLENPVPNTASMLHAI